MFRAGPPRKGTAAKTFFLVVGMLGTVARAQTWTREGPGAFFWSNPANWTSLPASSSATHLTFGSATPSPYTASNDLASSFKLNSLTVGGVGQGRITGNALQFESDFATLPSITLNGPDLFQISAPIILNAATTVANSGQGGPLILTGAISGSGSFTVGPGAAIVYGQSFAAVPNATFSGGAFISGGSLDLFAPSGSRTFGTGAISLTNASLNVDNLGDALWNIPNALNLSGDVTIQSANGTQVALNNQVTLAGVLRGKGLQFAAGTQLRIDDASAGLRAIYPAPLDAGQQTLVESAIVDLKAGIAPNPLHLAASNGDLVINGTGNTYSGGTVVEPNPFSTSTFVTVSAQSSLGAGNVTVQPGARLRIGSAINLAPGKTINVMSGAFVDFAPSLPFNNAAVSLIDPASQGMLLLTQTPAPGLSLVGHDKLILSTLTSATIATPYIPAAATFRLVAPAGASLTVSASSPNVPVLSGANALVIGQPGFEGDVFLKTPNTFSGGTTVVSGSAYASSPGALGTGDVQIPGGALYADSDIDAFGPSAKLNVSGGAVFLSFPNHFTGGTNLSAGRLSVGDAAALGSGPLTFAGGVLATSQSIPNPMNVTGDGFLEGGAAPTGALAGPITLVGARTLFIRNTFTLAGNITRSALDSGSLTINNSGTLNISGSANTFSGGVAIGGDGQVFVNAGSSLGIGNVALTAGELNVVADNAITGQATRFSVTGGLARLFAPANYRGGTMQSGGTIEIWADNALGTGDVVVTRGILRPAGAARSIPNSVSVIEAGVIDLNGQNLTVGALSGNGFVTNSVPAAATLAVTGDLQPGPGIGTLTLAGSAPNSVAVALGPASRTTIELAGALPGTLHDRLSINGPIALDGELHLALSPGYSPALDQFFDVVTSSSTSGHFSKITGIVVPNSALRLATLYLPDRVRIVAALPGDANLDHVVDFKDLVKIAQDYNHPNQTWITGDFNGDGAVDFFDLVQFAQNYNAGAPLPASDIFSQTFERDLAAAFAAVPEPAGAVVTIIAIICALTKRRPFSRISRPHNPRRVRSLSDDPDSLANRHRHRAHRVLRGTNF
jgi:hypothetical protein